MKKAFTLLELVFIIIIIGILIVAIIPKIQTNPVREAAIQLVSHIRYTQHLAMMDDRFDRTDSGWHKELWQIRFTNDTSTSNNVPAYVIFSDWIGGHTSHPEVDECAVDPLTGLLINGGVVNINYDDPRLLQEANLGNTYGINNISFSNSCRISGSMRIAFDHLGRPIRGNISGEDSVTDLRYIQTTCEITLSNGSESSVILIEPETGYTHIQ
ncbi:MAG: type II secretory pathway pseudopilin PulG [Sulfurimonas sp.]|jgi:type II secretory pathway pseudopilin PulG|uniref:type II/IV secretion system protein n=1 Tax=Sulfurimonas sp. TaxID=2022749 RepID=UPI0039E28674